MAEDLVQDVFISLLESDYKFKTENDIKYFLYSSLKNKCISHSRKQKVRDKYYQDVVSSLNEEEHFWDKVLEEDVYARLMAAIETLPPQCKLVMIMTLDGLKASEIAERLHISVDTVKDHKSNGKKKLTGCNTRHGSAIFSGVKKIFRRHPPFGRSCVLFIELGMK